MLRVLLLCFAAGLLISVPATAEPRCSDKQFSATGKPGRVHFAGRRNARLAWVVKVKAELGDRYATWDRAVSRSFNCTYSDFRYHCSATARPCRSFLAGR
jgi:hypothetical protein